MVSRQTAMAILSNQRLGVCNRRQENRFNGFVKDND